MSGLDGNAVVVVCIEDQRLGIVLAGLDQVQIIAATLATLEFPEPAQRPEHSP